MVDKLSLALADLDEETVLSTVQERLAAGGDPAAIMEACRDGVVTVGERFETGEYFISDLMMSAEILRQVSTILTPHMKAEATSSRGKVLVGTVKGDIHDIGKNIVVSMLKAAGYEVFDLGVDVPTQRFVEALQETGAPVLGLSGLLTLAFDAMKETIEAVAAAGLRPGVKVMIGGGPVTEKVCEYTGADGWGANAQVAVSLCNQWMEAGK